MSTAFVATLCCAAELDLHNGPEFSATPVKSDRSAINVFRRCQLPATRGDSLANSFLHFGANTCGSFAVAQVQHAEILHHLN